jgi:hypothetical protein
VNMTDRGENALKPPSWRWSLRSLLLLVALFAVCLALRTYYIQYARAMADLHERLEQENLAAWRQLMNADAAPSAAGAFEPNLGRECEQANAYRKGYWANRLLRIRYREKVESAWGFRPTPAVE